MLFCSRLQWETNLSLHLVREKTQNVDSLIRGTQQAVISLCFFVLFQEGEGNRKDALAEKNFCVKKNVRAKLSVCHGSMPSCQTSHKHRDKSVTVSFAGTPQVFLTQRMGSKTGRRWPGLAQLLPGAVTVRDAAPQPPLPPQPLFSQLNNISTI